MFWLLCRFVPWGLSNLEMIVFSLCVPGRRGVSLHRSAEEPVRGAVKIFPLLYTL